MIFISFVSLYNWLWMDVDNIHLWLEFSYSIHFHYNLIMLNKHSVQIIHCPLSFLIKIHHIIFVDAVVNVLMMMKMVYWLCSCWTASMQYMWELFVVFVVVEDVLCCCIMVLVSSNYVTWLSMNSHVSVQITRLTEA